jgi:hypothetical protein
MAPKKPAEKHQNFGLHFLIKKCHMLNIMLSLWVTSRVAPPAGAGATTG